VTIPAPEGVPAAHLRLAGYHPAGARAIRIDMLERLADMLRARDARAGFEATPEMLSITGLTLEQFVDLMRGLGYAAERGERPRQRPAPAPAAQPEAEARPQAEGEAGPSAEPADTTPPAADIAREDDAAALSSANEEPATSEADAVEAPEDETAVAAADSPSPEPQTAEMEVYFSFTWAPRRRPQERGPRQREPQEGREGQPRGRRGAQADRKGGEGQPSGGQRAPAQAAEGEAGRGAMPGKPRRGPAGDRPKKPAQEGPRHYAASPAKPARNDRIDPDNPFARALMGLRDKT
jgi:ATP-dependent RNA helicase SUPV3L1/SUV3